MPLTPVPWKIERFPNEGYVTIVGNTGQHVTDFVKSEDAHRIIASVNALIDLPTDLIEMIGKLDHPMLRLAAINVTSEDIGKAIQPIGREVVEPPRGEAKKIRERARQVAAQIIERRRRADAACPPGGAASAASL
jgi:hypothetical protein